MFSDLASFCEEMKQLSKSHKIKRSSIDIGKDQRFGKYIHIDCVLIAVDSWNPHADIIFVSHAHMDHVPSLPRNLDKLHQKGASLPRFIISKITKEVAELRTHGRFSIPEELWILGNNSSGRQKISINGVDITIMENGHAYGSLSLFIEGSESIFYTSDFMTEDRILPKNRGIIKGLKPRHCDILVTECTFGAPRYRFPLFRESLHQINALISDQFLKGTPLMLLGYAFGKSQVLLQAIEAPDKLILLDKTIASVVKILEGNGILFPEWEPYGDHDKRELIRRNDYLLLAPPYTMFKKPYEQLISNGAQTAIFSGKVIDASFRKAFPVDYYLSLSDHPDSDSLLEFVRECESQEIYIEHGQINKSFAFFSHNNLRILIY
ncbi:MAG: hypothetical protein JW891_04200 [Candidatus Lokiarchaeota archaeon]|nr:hypothetical protein [Candidatus Lokiarchaeota archaeon]